MSAEARFEVTSLDMTLLWRHVPFSIEPYTRRSHFGLSDVGAKAPICKGKKGVERGIAVRARASSWAAPRRVVARLDLDRGRGDVTFTLAESVSRDSCTHKNGD